MVLPPARRHDPTVSGDGAASRTSGEWNNFSHPIPQSLAAFALGVVVLVWRWRRGEECGGLPLIARVRLLLVTDPVALAGAMGAGLGAFLLVLSL